jgi:hypothetical protein
MNSVGQLDELKRLVQHDDGEPEGRHDREGDQ